MKAQGHSILCLATSALVLGFALTGMGDAHAQSGSVLQGKLLFASRCIGCHSLDTHRVGPALGTALGRTAGKASGFDYSPALAAATQVWSESTLKAWLTDPEALVPGQGMGYRVDSATDRDDIVAYLASLNPALALTPAQPSPLR